MIEKLTSTQELDLIKFREECLKIGLCTTSISKNQRKIVDFIYKNYLSLSPPKIWYIDSPLMFNLVLNFIFSDLGRNLGSNLEGNLMSDLEGNLMSNLMSNLRSNLESNLESSLRSNLESSLESNLMSNLESSLRSNLESSLESNLGSNLESNLESSLRSNLESNLRSNLWSNLGSNLESNLGSNLGSNLWSNLGSNLWSNLRSNLRSNLGKFENIYWGNTDIYWLSFYIFPEKYLGIKYDEFQSLALNYFFELTKNIGWIWYFRDICFISDRPSAIHKKGIQLHNEKGAAISFRDGYSIWCLNGVNVSREIVETPSEKMDAHILLKEKNAEVRREIVRKIGIERVCQKLNAKQIDKSPDGVYELLLLELGDGRKRPYLKMKNPSIGIYHIEGVPVEIDTVEKALNWRNQTDENPLILT